MSTICQYRGLNPKFRNREYQCKRQTVRHQATITIGKYQIQIQVQKKGKLGLKVPQFIKERTKVGVGTLI